MTKVLNIAAAAILNKDNQMLVVRKRGTDAFMQPGGKIDSGEKPIDALVRELKEELNFKTHPDQFELLGEFSAEAANEPDHIVNATVYRCLNDGPFEGAAEIEAVKWYSGENEIELAPLTEFHVLPACGVGARCD